VEIYQTPESITGLMIMIHFISFQKKPKYKTVYEKGPEYKSTISSYHGVGVVNGGDLTLVQVIDDCGGGDIAMILDNKKKITDEKIIELVEEF